MHHRPRRLCLVTPAHPANNPRLVKEADALAAAGHTVHVVAGRYLPSLDAFDAEIYQAARWSRTVVNYRSGPRSILERIRHRLARRRLARGDTISPLTTVRAHHAAIFLLAEAAARVDAELYLGHCLAGLAAAGLAAEWTNRRLGFDAEDFHSAETREAEEDPVNVASIREIENRWLPRCAHFTAASPLIGQAYAERLGLAPPVTLLNVFPKSEAPREPVQRPDPKRPAVLYWFSQTIGAGRGLEQLVAALAQMKTPCGLHLRGQPAKDFRETLLRCAATHGFHGPIEFLPLAAPGEMARLAATADLGLSLEESEPRNRDLCLTNKIFTYLLAGIPVALTPTSAQSALAAELGAAAVSLDLSDPTRAAGTLDAFLGDPLRRAAARKAAWKLAHERFNWDLEQARLIEALDRNLG